MINEARIDNPIYYPQAEPIPDWIPIAESEDAIAPNPQPHESEPLAQTNEGEPGNVAAPQVQRERSRGLAVKRDLMTTYESGFSAGSHSDLLAATSALGPDTSAEAITSTPEDAVDPTLVAEEDFSQLGAAFAGRRPPQTFWNEEAVNTISGEGLRQRGLSAEQAEQNALLAQELLGPETALDGEGPRSIIAGDLALIVRESGISFSRQDPGQLNAAASYVNDAADLAEQQERLRKTLDVFHTLDKQGLPQLSREQMIGQLWVAARVPTHAIEKMSDAEMSRTLQDVAAVINGPAGQQKLKVGKHELSLTVNDANQVVDSQTKKPSIWGKIGKIALTVASFVPGPVGIAARIASSVISAAEGIKNKNWLQGVIGAASGVAAGAGAIAGRAVAGAAATTARVADSVARGARSLQAGLQALHARDGAGVFRSLAGMGSAVAGAVGDSAETVAGWARNVEKWAGRAYVAAEVRNISRMNFGDQLLAVGTHGANMILDSGDLRPASSSLEVKWKLGINMGQTVRAGLRLQEAIKSGDVLLMSEAAAGLSATTQNAYRNASIAPFLLNAFEAQKLNAAGTSQTTRQSDLQFDGAWIGNQGSTSVSGGPLAPTLPSGGLQTNVPTVYVNGILNSVADQARFMQGLADATGSAVYGIHNSSQGVFKDIWQSLQDKLDFGRNPPVDTLAAYVRKQLMSGGDIPVNLMAHSQGALIISRALNDVKNQLLLEDRYSKQEVDSMLSRVSVTTFGGASGHYPNGPQYTHYINRGDYVAMPAGLGLDLIPGIPILHGGRGARFIRFTDFSLPNPHDSNIYLNMYRQQQNRGNPYTPEEIKRYKISR